MENKIATWTQEDAEELFNLMKVWSRSEDPVKNAEYARRVGELDDKRQAYFECKEKES